MFNDTFAGRDIEILHPTADGRSDPDTAR